MPHSSSHIYLHLVFATKKRQLLIAEDFRVELERYLASIYRNAGQILLAHYAMPDHYHSLFRLNPSASLASFVKTLKSSSAHFVNEVCLPGNFAWQNGYGVFSHTAGDLEAVTTYIRNQPMHHATRSFEREVELLNEKYGGDWVLENE